MLHWHIPDNEILLVRMTEQASTDYMKSTSTPHAKQTEAINKDCDFCSSKCSFRIVWTTATHWCMSLRQITSSPAVSAELCCRMITGTHHRDHITPVLRQLHCCQSISKSCSRSQGLYISRSVEWIGVPCTSLTTVTFCWMLVVAHCSLIPMTCGSCLCREHTNLAIGVSRPPVLDRGTTFLPDYGGQYCPSTSSDNLIHLATEVLSDSIDFIGVIQIYLTI